MASGKTHLLNASADFAHRQGVSLQIYDAVQLRSCDANEFAGFNHCEVLVVDNGSAEKSYLEQLPSAYKDAFELRCFRIEDGNASVARNIGIKQAQGAFIALLDADDIWFSKISFC